MNAKKLHHAYKVQRHVLCTDSNDSHIEFLVHDACSTFVIAYMTICIVPRFIRKTISTQLSQEMLHQVLLVLFTRSHLERTGTMNFC